MAASVQAVKVHEAPLEVMEDAPRVVPQDIPFVVDCNNAHTLADIRRDEARWRALDLLFFEDPFWPPEELLGMEKMAGVPIGMGADFGSTEQMGLYARAPAVPCCSLTSACWVVLSRAPRARRWSWRRADRGAAYAVLGPAALASLHLLATAGARLTSRR